MPAPTPHCPNVQPCPVHPSKRWADGGRSGYTQPPGWAATRRRVLARDSRTCQLRLPGCTVVATEVDHRQPVSLGGDSSDANCQAVCHHCHVAKTAKEAQAAAALHRP